MGLGKKYKKYDRQFKEAAQSLGIPPDRLYNWRQKNQKVSSGGSHDKVSPNNAEQELRRLQREDAALKEDHKILKKALAIFSKQPK